MKKYNPTRLIAALLLISAYSCNQAPKVTEKQGERTVIQEQKVYEWRGENRSGIYNETGLLKVWPEGGPELVWELRVLVMVMDHQFLPPIVCT